MSEIRRGYFDKNGIFREVIHGNKAFEYVDGEFVVYKVKEYRWRDGVLEGLTK